MTEHLGERSPGAEPDVDGDGDRGRMEAEREALASQLSPEMADLCDEAFGMMMLTQAALAQGGGHQEHPGLVRMRGAVGALVATWIQEANPACPQEAPGVRLESARTLLPRLQESEGDFAADLRAAGTPALVRVGEALARLLPLEKGPLMKSDSLMESDSLVEGQISRRHLEGLRTRLQDIRSVLVGEGAGAVAGDDLAGDDLAQEVADHYALALAASEIIGAAARAAELRAAEKGTLASERTARAWSLRRNQAGIRLREARRHLRHVRKAGLLGKDALAAQDVEKRLSCVRPRAQHKSIGETWTQGSGVLDGAKGPCPSESPRSVVIGEEREHARRTRQQWQDGLSAARALQEAWPPPERIATRELWRPECPYNPFCYVPGGDGEDDMGGDNLESLGTSTRPWVLACEHPAPSDILDEYEVPEAMRVGFALPRRSTGCYVDRSAFSDPTSILRPHRLVE